MPNSMWPNDLLNSPVPTTPRSILKEQAALLGPMTNNLVIAEVFTRTDPSGRGFMHEFNLVVPTIGNYQYELFSAAHNVNLYPVTVFLPGDPLLEANDETDFRKLLAHVFSSQRTRHTIGTLLAQARDM